MQVQASSGRRVGLLESMGRFHTPPAGFNHFEKPERVEAIMKELEQTGLAGRCLKLEGRQATVAELKMAHTTDHLASVRELADKAGEARPAATAEEVQARLSTSYDLDSDNYYTAQVDAMARLAAGGAIVVTAAVITEECENGFAIIRPPGHHAGCAHMGGFCFYNNAALAAHKALQEGIKRVLILDWDVHHGNGTQEIFYDDPRVLFISAHRRDRGFYPSSKQGEPEPGEADQVGSEFGEGTTVNIPWIGEGYGDMDYMAAFHTVVMPIARDFNPELVIVSAGFDAAEGDPLGKCKVSPGGYGHMTEMLMQLGSVVCILEGGYDTMVISQCAAEVLKVLLGGKPQQLRGLLPHKSTSRVLTKVQQVQSKFWEPMESLPRMPEQLKQVTRLYGPGAAAAQELAESMGGLGLAAGRRRAGGASGSGSRSE